MKSSGKTIPRQTTKTLPIRKPDGKAVVMKKTAQRKTILKKGSDREVVKAFAKK
jgi:hypothetical protein